jgi:hypothetical protein
MEKMSPRVNILVLAAGKFDTSGIDYDYPMCLTEIESCSLLERIVSNTKNIKEANYYFAFLNSEAKRFHLDKIATLLAPGSVCTYVPEVSQGSACTALLTACRLDQDAELLIISANELVDLDLSDVIQEFRLRRLDAATITFRSINPNYSYVFLNTQGYVTEAAQRKPISLHATTGIFWYAKTSFFVNGAKNLIRKDAHVEGKYFIAPTFNEMILQNKKIGVKKVDINKYIPMKNQLQFIKKLSEKNNYEA